ncbi:MAG: flagellar protein FlaG [Gammaproteobacteria bacterium]|nr:flagellar protein FlaG [Gammaproteobacteria bacterium]
MEITTSQTPPATLDGTKTPAKVSVVVPSVARVESADTATIDVTQAVSQDETAQNLQGAVSQINDYVQNLQRSLLFTVDEASGKDVVTVLDSETEEVIRQYPSDEILAIARRLAEQKDEQLNLFSSII